MISKSDLPLTVPGEDVPQMVKVRRNMTRVAIIEDPVEVVLQRKSTGDGEAGGFDTGSDPEELSPQIFRIYSYGRLWDVDERDSRGGVRRELLWSILAMFNADIQRDDYFDIVTEKVPQTGDNDDDGPKRRFEARFVRPQTLHGNVVSKQVELRELT